ncbi:helix-turn-helix transcriptional regulator [Allorhizocola rhizosphaerae]|uniref:helix-turn-helix transcriptional regulator n=1 Tax=Allorhizocola rhizosphaerae TaxID=1872709 RepID=UPI000E3C1C43|nr:helix-turn-helix domain-containing protein [Allorhizocola rhizosphaerae]
MVDPWSAVTTLADASRRALFDYVRRQDHAVSREEAADATGMSRGLAAFHLDKLAEVGLLSTRYAATPGRGRSPKVYFAPVAVNVSIPQRHYEILARILAGAVADEPSNVERAAHRAAHDLGAAYGVGALDGLGFEPERRGDRIVLRNCPFQELAQAHTELICALNLSFVAGMLQGSPARAELAPQPGCCCVAVTGTV